MKHLFLTSQVQYVAEDIGRKIKDEVSRKAVFIDTCLQDKKHTNLDWQHLNKASMEKIGIKFDLYNIADKSEQQIVNELSQYGIMYVEGGNSFYLLQESQKNNFSAFVNKRVSEGMIYISTSAGTVAAGPDIEAVRQDDRAALAPYLKGTKGFNLVNCVIMPHWGQEKRRELFNSYRLNHIYQENYPYIFLSDNQYVEVIGDNYQIIDVSKR